MKKFVLLFAVLAMAFAANAGTLSAFTNYGPVAWESVDTAYNIYSRDSLKAADTIILFNKVKYDPGYMYAVVTTDSVGATDTIRMDQIFYATSSYNGKTVQIMDAKECDTIVPTAATSSMYRVSALTVGNPWPCNRFTVRAISWISAKVAIIRRAELWKAKSALFKN
jgi:hypothetical protein